MSRKERSDFRALASAVFSSSWPLANCNSFAAWLSDDEDEDESESEEVSCERTFLFVLDGWYGLALPRGLPRSASRRSWHSWFHTRFATGLKQKLTLTLDGARHVGKASFHK